MNNQWSKFGVRVSSAKYMEARQLLVPTIGDEHALMINHKYVATKVPRGVAKVNWPASSKKKDGR